MKTLMTTAAFAALLAVAPAFAQSETAPTADQPPAVTEPAPGTEVAPAPDTAAPEQPAMAPETAPDTAAPAPDAAPDTAVAPAPDTGTAVATDQMFIDKQADDAKLASNWIGQTLYNSADESLGDINDLLFNQDGKVAAVIIGVGGFLGIGEKEVAIAFDSINASSDADGNVKLVASVTREQIDAAPEFLTLADIKAQQEAPVAPDAMAPAEPAPAQ